MYKHKKDFRQKSEGAVNYVQFCLKLRKVSQRGTPHFQGGAIRIRGLKKPIDYYDPLTAVIWLETRKTYPVSRATNAMETLQKEYHPLYESKVKPENIALSSDYSLNNDCLNHTIRRHLLYFTGLTHSAGEK